MRRDERIALGRVLGIIDGRRAKLQNRRDIHEIELLKTRSLIKKEFGVTTETQVSKLKAESMIRL